MDIDQKYTPKYWCAHDITSDDVYTCTMSKSLSYSQELFHQSLADYLTEEELINIRFSLVEVKLIEMSDNYRYHPEDFDEGERE